jgi:hypothetical protein
VLSFLPESIDQSRASHPPSRTENLGRTWLPAFDQITVPRGFLAAASIAERKVCEAPLAAPLK